MATSVFARFEDRDIADLVADYPLAWVSAGIGGPASLLPLLADLDADGRLVGLIGHCARRNPLVAALAAAPVADILFTGPQGYIAPRLVSRPGWAPTWNYVHLRIEAEVVFDDDGADNALSLLIDHLEGGQPEPWTVAAMGARYERLRAEIIAFRARVRHVDARFKLGQDEAVDTLREILAGHRDAALTRWMRRLNADRL